MCVNCVKVSILGLTSETNAPAWELSLKAAFGMRIIRWRENLSTSTFNKKL